MNITSEQAQQIKDTIAAILGVPSSAVKGEVFIDHETNKVKVTADVDCHILIEVVEDTIMAASHSDAIKAAKIAKAAYYAARIPPVVFGIDEGIRSKTVTRSFDVSKFGG